MIRIRKGPVALVLITLAAEIAYVAVKGSKEMTDGRIKSKTMNGGNTSKKSSQT